MAERRMMAKSVIETDLFMDMPMSTQCLYFHLLIRADDDGFIKNPSAIRRETGCSADDMTLLIAKQYIIPFESGVIVIRHWRVHNWVRGDRKHPTDCQEILLLSVRKDGTYELKSDCLSDGCQVVDSGLSDGCQLVDSCHTEDRLGKDRLGKDRLGKDRLGKDKEAVADAPCAVDNSKSRKKSKELSPFEMVEDEALREALLEYRDMRKQIKARMTVKAEQLALSKLRNLTHDLDEAVEIVNQSIMNSWKGLFPLKQERVQMAATVNPQVNAINDFLSQVEVVEDETY